MFRGQPNGANWKIRRSQAASSAHTYPGRALSHRLARGLCAPDAPSLRQEAVAPAAKLTRDVRSYGGHRCDARQRLLRASISTNRQENTPVASVCQLVTARAPVARRGPRSRPGERRAGKGTPQYGCRCSATSRRSSCCCCCCANRLIKFSVAPIV